MLLTGALVRWNGGFHRVADPLRHFADGLGSLPNPVGSPLDKVLVGLFRLKSLLKTPDAIFQSPETTTYSRLKVGRLPSRLCCMECMFCLVTRSEQDLSWLILGASILFILQDAAYCYDEWQAAATACRKQCWSLLYRQRASRTPS